LNEFDPVAEESRGEKVVGEIVEIVFIETEAINEKHGAQMRDGFHFGGGDSAELAVASQDEVQAAV